jgi:hypothetical protein
MVGQVASLGHWVPGKSTSLPTMQWSGCRYRGETTCGINSDKQWG